MNEDTSPPPSPAPPTLPDPNGLRPADGPPPGAIVAQLELAIVGRVQRYHPPNTFLRRDAEPDEKPITVWCVELDSKDVLVWDKERFTVLTEAESMILGGACAGIGALFKGVLGKAKEQKLNFGRVLELLALALALQSRALEQSAERAQSKNEALQYARSQAVAIPVTGPSND